MLVKCNWLKLWWRFFGFFFPLKAERANVGVRSALSTCRATWNMALGWEGKLDPTLTHLPFLVCLTCLLTLSYQRQKPSRAKNFPCYCACKTPGIMGPLSECHQNKNTPGFPKLWNLGCCGRTPHGWGGRDRNGMGALSTGLSSLSLCNGKWHRSLRSGTGMREL